MPQPTQVTGSMRALRFPVLGCFSSDSTTEGAAALDALAAGDALVGIHHAGGLGAAGDEHAVPARDEHGNPVVGGALFKRLPDGGEIEGIRGEHLSTPQARHSPAMSTGATVPRDRVASMPGLS